MMFKKLSNIRFFSVFMLVMTVGCSSHNTVSANTSDITDHRSISEFSTLLDSLENNASPLATGTSVSSSELFYQSAWKFWIAHKENFNDKPDDYRKVLDQYYRLKAKFPQNHAIKLEQHQATIDQFKRFDQRNSLPADPILFIGSSSIVYWETARAFPNRPVINRGFGGASMEEIIHYYDDIIKPHQPAAIVIYCDINIEIGQQPKAVLTLYKTLLARIEQDFPQAKVLLLSMKPTLVDHILGQEVLNNKNITNQQLKALSQQKNKLHFVDVAEVMRLKDGRVNPELFLDDGMHLNEKGYQEWNPLMKRALNQVMQESR